MRAAPHDDVPFLSPSQGELSRDTAGPVAPAEVEAAAPACLVGVADRAPAVLVEGELRRSTSSGSRRPNGCGEPPELKATGLLVPGCTGSTNDVDLLLSGTVRCMARCNGAGSGSKSLCESESLSPAVVSSASVCEPLADAR